jgi:hypothetical protein
MRGIGHVLMATRIVTERTRRAAIGLTVTGCILSALEAVMIYLIARWLLRVMF